MPQLLNAFSFQLPLKKEIFDLQAIRFRTLNFWQIGLKSGDSISATTSQSDPSNNKRKLDDVKVEKLGVKNGETEVMVDEKDVAKRQRLDESVWTFHSEWWQRDYADRPVIIVR